VSELNSHVFQFYTSSLQEGPFKKKHTHTNKPKTAKEHFCFHSFSAVYLQHAHHGSQCRVLRRKLSFPYTTVTHTPSPEHLGAGGKAQQQPLISARAAFHQVVYKIA